MTPADGFEPERRGRTLVLWAGGIALLAAIGFLPGWWERRLYRQTEALTGVGASVHSGTLANARRRVDPGRTAAQITAALGPPSQSMSSQGSSPRGVWTYYYADGTMVLNMTDGIAQRISVRFGPPLIPTSRRPR